MSTRIIFRGKTGGDVDQGISRGEVMADNIRNFNDYRKKIKNEEQFTEEIDIEIQDPLDFLSADEREEYYRTQHAAMDKERESISKDSPEFFFDDEDSEQAVQQPVERRERESGRSEQRKSEPRKSESKSPVKERPVSKKEKKKEDKPSKENKRAIRKRAKEEYYEDIDEDDNEGGIDPMLIVRISSIITGLVILVLIGMIFKAKIYDRYLTPEYINDEDTQIVVKVALPDGYTETSDKVITTVDLNLRKAPNTDDDALIATQVPKGTTLDRVAASDDGKWAQIKYEDQVLYCVMKYVTVQE